MTPRAGARPIGQGTRPPLTIRGACPPRVIGARIWWALFAYAAIGMPASASAQAVPESEGCVQCHLGLDEERLVEPAALFPEDIHAETGFGCLSCHGGGGAGVLDPNRGFLSTPARSEIPELCGQCHSDAAYMRQFNPSLRVDQVTEYWTSGHGERLLASDDPDVATCVDCHQVHRIRPPSDPESSVYVTNVPDTCGRCHSDVERMAGRDISTDQMAEHAESVHGRLLFEEGDLTAPVCNDCHGNHGAAPPGVVAVGYVCGQCHSVMADYFDASEHVELFEEDGLPLCATCHGNHAIAAVDETSLTERSEQVCRECHVPNDPAGLAFEAMAAILDSLTSEGERGRSLLEEAESLGMEVSQALFELEEIGNAQTRARSAIHTFHLEPVQEQVAAGLEITDRAVEQAEEAFAEYDFRRLGLAGTTSIIVLLIVGLWLRIRETERSIEELIHSIDTFFDRAMGTPGLEPTPEQTLPSPRRAGRRRRTPDLAPRDSIHAPALQPRSAASRPARSRQLLSSLRLLPQRPPALPPRRPRRRLRQGRRQRDRVSRGL